MLCICSLYSLFIYTVASVLGLSVILCLVLYLVSEPFPRIVRSQKERYFRTSKDGPEQLFPTLDDPWSVNLSVIVPAYNEQLRLVPMLEECLEVLEKRRKEWKGFSYEVIVVSDGSRDDTVGVALGYTEKYGHSLVRVLELNPNRGKGGAVRLGVQSARGAVMLFADADGATTFSDLSKLEDSLKSLIQVDYVGDGGGASAGQGLVCGSRAHLEEESIATRSWFRTLLMKGFHLLVWALAVRSIRDTQCGFKLFTRATARTLFSSLHVERWAFDVELLYMCEALRIPTAEVAVTWVEVDGSKVVPVLSWIQMAVDLLLISLRYATSAWKIKSK